MDFYKTDKIPTSCTNLRPNSSATEILSQTVLPSNLQGNSWIILPSSRIKHKSYFYNILTNESVWNWEIRVKDPNSAVRAAEMNFGLSDAKIVSSGVDYNFRVQQSVACPKRLARAGTSKVLNKGTQNYMASSANPAVKTIKNYPNKFYTPDTTFMTFAEMYKSEMLKECMHQLHITTEELFSIPPNSCMEKDHLNNRLNFRMEEWWCRFVQFMAYALSNFLMESTNFKELNLPRPPWSLYEAVECTKTCYGNYGSVKAVADVFLCSIFSRDLKSDQIPTTISPNNFKKIFSYGYNFILCLMDTIPGNEHIMECHNHLKHILADIKNPESDNFSLFEVNTAYSHTRRA